jgi:hypothetical protein
MRESIAILTPSSHRLERLVGLREQLDNLLEDASSKVGHPLIAKCRAVAAAHPFPSEPIRVEAMYLYRKTVGHRVVDKLSAIGIAHALVNRKSQKIVVLGNMPKAVASRAGLRRVSNRRFSKDPVEHERIATDLGNVLQTWSLRFVAGQGAAWHSALVVRVPQRADETHGTRFHFFVAMDELGSVTRELYLPDAAQLPVPLSDDGDAALRSLVSQALVQNMQEKFPDLTPDENLFVLGMSMRPPLDIERFTGFGETVKVMLMRGERAALARFRRSFSSAIIEHAARSQRPFADRLGAVGFFRARAGWNATDYQLAQELRKTLPWLEWRHLLYAPVQAGFRARKPLASFIPTLFGLKGLHRKTLKALVGVRLGDGFRYEVLEQGVHAYEKLLSANPHAPVPSGREFKTLAWMASNFGEVDALGFNRVVKCYRDERGLISSAKANNAPSVFRWISGQIATATGIELIWARKAGLQVVFPENRDLDGLDKLDRDWHLVSRSLSDAERRDNDWARTQCMPDTEVIEELTAQLYPHLIAEPKRFGEVTFTPLVTTEQFFAEGKEMLHCVATYAGDAAVGRSLILGLSSPAGRSTLELVLHLCEQTGYRLAVQQLQGVNNGDPPVDHVPAVVEFAKAFEIEDLEALLVRIQAAHKAGEELAAVGTPTPEMKAWLASRAMDRVRPFLPRSWRRLDGQQLRDLINTEISTPAVREAAIARIRAAVALQREAPLHAA